MSNTPSKAEASIPWADRFDAVVFDLFGTLVPVFNRRAHQSAMVEVADILQVPDGAIRALWERTYGRRISGEFSTIEAYLAWVCEELSDSARRVGHDQLQAAARRYTEFTRRNVVPAEDVLATLSALPVPIGLLSNCAPDVPGVVAESGLGNHVDATIFSGRDGLRKPDPAAYTTIAARLGVLANKVLYVGDGSDHELTGAAAVGMHAVLVRADLGDSYDTVRADVADWSGPVLEDIPALLSYRP